MYAQIPLLVNPDYQNTSDWGSDVTTEPLCYKCTHKYCCWYILIIKTLIFFGGSDIMTEPLRSKCTHKYHCCRIPTIKTFYYLRLPHHSRACALQMYAQILLLVNPDYQNILLFEAPTSRQSLCAPNIRTNTAVGNPWLSEHPIIWGSNIMAEPLRCECTHKYCCWYTLIIKT